MARPHILDALADRVLLCDGGMGSRVQALTLDVDKDYWGKENCTDVLNLSRPDMVREIHRGYFEAGADMVLTNTFGGSPVTLGEFELEDRAFEINKLGGELAREAAESFADDRHRWVIGDIGPGTKLPSLGHIKYDDLQAALEEQCRGLIAGGVDAILTETNQDTLFIKAAVNAAKAAIKQTGVKIPIFVQVTVETTGTLLVGPDIAAAATVVHSLDVPLIGLNCATGPQEMAEHVRWLSQNWPGKISVQPNAGLPELVDGQTHYPLEAAEMASWMERFVLEDGVNLIGGCCGTSTPHIQALDAMLRKHDAWRPAPVRRKYHWIPSVASLYGATALRQENAYFSIGERCNANGSKVWRARQEAHDWDGCVAIGREQVGEGSNSLDVCTAFVGRNEMEEMNEVITRFTSSVNAPLVIDSTETPVIEAALKLHGGKPIINSINFEDGEQAAIDRLVLAKKFGAGVIALTIDEVGMAKTAEDKLRIARRLIEFACDKYGLPQSDLLIDPLTFTIATGNEDDRKLGQWTLEGIKMIRDEFPDVQIVLGLSNISFGLNPAARHVLNSVFLDHAVKAGMTGAIVHVSKIKPLHLIPAEEVQVVEDLIFDRRRGGLRPAAEAAGDLLRPQGRRQRQEGPCRDGRGTAQGPHRRRRPQGPRRRAPGRARPGQHAAQHHQRRAARRHEGGRRALRRRQDAAALRAPVRGDDEGRRRLPRALHGEDRGPGEGHHRPRHGEGRRARHRQEPGRHHPDQQRLPRRQPRHQGAAGRHGRRGEGAPGACHRHVRPAGEIHRGDAREPRGDEAPGPGSAGAARRRRADPQLRRGRLRPRLCQRRADRPRRLCPGCLRRPAPDGQGHRQRLRRLPRRGAIEAQGQVEERKPDAGHRRPARLRPGGCRLCRGTPPPADRRTADAGAALLGRPRHRNPRPRPSSPSSTSAASTNSSGASGSRAARWKTSSAGPSRSCARC